MGLPGKKLSRSSKRRRASHFALTPLNLSKCPKCKKPIRSHHVCLFCGYYAGEEVIKIKSKLDKKKQSKAGRSRGGKVKEKTEKEERKEEKKKKNK